MSSKYVNDYNSNNYQNNYYNNYNYDNLNNNNFNNNYYDQNNNNNYNNNYNNNNYNNNNYSNNNYNNNNYNNNNYNENIVGYYQNYPIYSSIPASTSSSNSCPYTSKQSQNNDTSNKKRKGPIVIPFRKENMCMLRDPRYGPGYAGQAIGVPSYVNLPPLK